MAPYSVWCLRSGASAPIDGASSTCVTSDWLKAVKLCVDMLTGAPLLPSKHDMLPHFHLPFFILKAPCSPPTYSAQKPSLILFYMTFQRLQCSAPIFKSLGSIFPNAKVGAELIRDVPRCSHTWLVIIHVNVLWCTCSRCSTVWFYKTDQNQHGTPVRRWLNAQELLAITITDTWPVSRIDSPLIHPVDASILKWLEI